MQQTTRSIPRNQKIILQCVAACVVFALFFRFWSGSKDHYLSSDLVNYTADAAEDEIRFEAEEARSICRKHGFAYYEVEKRKVYDLILLHNELDWLEIRLRTLSPFVDYFVVVESHTTFAGKSKPLSLQDNWEMFRDHHDKIIHRVVYDPIQSDQTSDHEKWLRDSMFTEVFPGIVGTRFEAHNGDVLMVSEPDEIARPGAMLLLRHCDIPTRLALGSDFYSYSFQWLRRGPQWAHPDATIYKGQDTVLPSDLRLGSEGGRSPPQQQRKATLWNAGWYCFGCFATIAEVRTKMESMPNQSLNTVENRNAQTIIGRVRNGKDLYGRLSEVFERVERNEDVPEFILSQNRLTMRFRALLDRNGEDASFDDWESASRDG